MPSFTHRTMSLGCAALVALTLSTAGLPDGRAQAPVVTPHAVAAPLTPGTGSIRGVVRGDGGRAVVGALLSVSRLLDPQIVVATTRTRSNGSYTLQRLPAPESYEVCASTADATGPGVPATGLVDGCVVAGSYVQDYLPHGSVFVAAGQTTPAPDLTLVAGGAVSGTVSNGTVGLRGVTVTAVAQLVSGETAATERAVAAANAAGLEPRPYDQAYLRTAVTAGNGSYTMTGLPPGVAQVCFSGTALPGAGYRAACHTSTSTPGTAQAYDPIQVAVGGSSAAGTDVLAPGAAMAGTVAGPDGSPLAGVGVDVVPVHNGFPATATTDAQGRYRVAGLAGAYTVCAHAPDTLLGPGGTGFQPSCVGSPERASATPLAPGGGTDLTLPVGGAIGGTARRVDGTPVPYARVEIDGRSAAVTRADRTGRYLVPGLVGGVNEVCFQPDEGDCSITAIDVMPGAVSTVSQRLPNSIVSLTGVVTGRDGEPVPDATVTTGGVPTRSAPDGTFAVANLEPGTYRVSAESDAAGYASDCHAPVSAAVTNSGTPPNIELVLPRGATVTGTILDDGVPVAGADVRSNTYDGCFTSAVHATTDRSGHYTLAGQAAGTDSIHVTPPPNGPAPGILAANLSLTTTAGHTTSGADLTLPAGAGVTGTVVDADGMPVAGVLITDVVRTGSDGRYTLSGLAGDLTAVCFNPPRTGPARILLPECYRDRPYGGRPRPTRVHLKPGATTAGIDGTLGAGASVAGTVRAPDGSPLGGVTVFTDTYAPRAVTAPDGTYRLDRLPTGVRLCFAPGAATNRLATTGFQYSCYPSGDRRSRATPVALTPGAVVTADQTLPLGAAVAGIVRDQFGDPVTGAQIEVAGPDNTFHRAISRAGGQFLLTGLSPRSGQQAEVTPYVQSSPVLPGDDPDYVYAYPEVYQDLPALRVGTRATGTEFNLDRAGGVSGRVTDAAGRPLEGALVTVTTSPQEVVPFESGTFTQPDGTYSVPALPAGHARVCFVNDGYKRECYDDVQAPGDAVTVTAGTFTTGIDAQLTTSGG